MFIVNMVFGSSLHCINFGVVVKDMDDEDSSTDITIDFLKHTNIEADKVKLTGDTTTFTPIAIKSSISPSETSLKFVLLTAKILN